MACKIYSVTDLNRTARGLLESQLSLVWVAGEMSNLARPGSGHLYFSLKDENAQVRCAMFRYRSQLMDFEAENGMLVVARGRVSLFEARGDFQLVVEHLAPAGAGALQQAFERLKQRLLAEGLFDAAHKKPLPRLPQRLGIITSPSGAAVRDVLTVLKRRFPAIAVRIYPVPVQGKEAPAALVAALHLANARQECDLLLLTRGGGSLEDLQAFNEESVARAIFASHLPVISAIGHEVDFCISDFVADVRAPTPSAAAELLSPDAQQWRLHNAQLSARLYRAIQEKIQQKQRHLHNLHARLRHPRQQLAHFAQRLDHLSLRLRTAMQQQTRQERQRLQTVQARLTQQNPAQRLAPLQAQQRYLQHRLQQAMQQQLHRYQQQLHSLAHSLNTLSPLATVQRGYAIVRDSQGQIIRQAQAVPVGAEVQAKLATGALRCRVLSVLQEMGH